MPFMYLTLNGNIQNYRMVIVDWYPVLKWKAHNMRPPKER
jgi:hypothetical protein